MLLEDVKTALRISLSNTALDGEVLDLIDAARQDLKLSGVSAEKADGDDLELDPIIKRAITIYAKANFGFDNPDFERLQKSYESLKNHLSLAGDYNAVP